MGGEKKIGEGPLAAGRGEAKTAEDQIAKWHNAGREGKEVEGKKTMVGLQYRKRRGPGRAMVRAGFEEGKNKMKILKRKERGTSGKGGSGGSSIGVGMLPARKRPGEKDCYK